MVALISRGPYLPSFGKCGAFRNKSQFERMARCPTLFSQQPNLECGLKNAWTMEQSSPHHFPKNGKEWGTMRRLHNALQGRGVRCWLDEKQLLPGDDIYEQVDRGVRLWEKVLLC